MLASGIPTRFPIPFGSSAGAGYIRTVPQASQIGIQNGAASLTDGFPPWCFTPPGYPFGQDFNGLLKQITQWNQWQGAGGPVTYDATFSSGIGGYPKGAVLAAANFGFCWLSTVDNNTSNPDSGGANWLAFTPLPLYATDTGTANAISITIPQTVTSLAQLAGQSFSVQKIASANTAAATMAVNTFSGSLVRPDGTALVSGELPSAVRFRTFCDGTKFFLQSPTGSAAFKAATDPTQTSVASAKGSFTIGHALVAADTSGTVKDGGGAFASVFSTFSNVIFGTTYGPFAYSSTISSVVGFTIKLKCISAELGFSVNNIALMSQLSNENRGVTVYLDNSGNFYFTIISTGIQLEQGDITAAKWQISAGLFGTGP